MNSANFISVIITAYDRKDYLRMAVDSVRNQTLNKMFFEIIVVKNFEDRYVDNIKEKNFTSVNMEGSIGEYISIGIEKSRGNIICFLDDDDEFYPNKIQEVYDAFETHIQLGYYHNSFRVIDKEGKQLKNRFGYKQPKRELYISKQVKEKYLFKLAKHHGTFNASCVAVRRSTIFTQIPYLKNISASTDGALYIIALRSNSDILVTPKVLNKYRVHGNQTRPLTKGKWSAVNKKMLEATTSFSDFLKGTRFEKYGNSNKFYWLIKCKISEERPDITWGNVLDSFRYFVLTSWTSFFSITVILMVLKVFRISPIDIHYK